MLYNKRTKSKWFGGWEYLYSQRQEEKKKKKTE